MNIPFPRISSLNLEGQKLELPYDFKGNLTIAILAFKREQQDLIDEWLPFIDDLARRNPDLAYYELPTLNFSYILFRGIIDGGMKAGISDKSARERTITLYLDKKAFRKKLDIQDEKTIHILLINKKGDVIWRTRGGFSEEKYRDLENAVKININT